MPGFSAVKNGVEAVSPLIPQYIARYPYKYYWFQHHGYTPHVWQVLFHGAHRDDDLLVRMRHLSAGRRGGKTLSASWEVLYYALHPRQFHMDAHGVDSDEPLWIWVLSKSYKLTRPSLITFLQVMRRAGLVKGRDYEYNKTERTIEFPDGTLIEFKTADDPDNLRGPGLDILWIDEAAMLPDDEAWNTIRPALSDKLGLLITTTTPKGKNWLWDEFWSKLADDPNQFRVEYRTIDNTAVPALRAEWEYAKKTYHPLMFKQEYEASFDAMAGVALSGDWLHYYVVGKDTVMPNPDDDVRLIFGDGRSGLRTYLAVDPATGEGEDDFAMALIGVAEDNSRVYLIDTYKARIPFPDQLDVVSNWVAKYRPMFVGVEAIAYQRVLVQQLQRLPGMPNVIPVFTRGKKAERIMAMSPLFKTGRMRIHRRHRDFIDQWISYDPTLAHPKDDLLDATEIALGLAGVLLPREFEGNTYEPEFGATKTLQQLADDGASLLSRSKDRYDEELGAEMWS